MRDYCHAKKDVIVKEKNWVFFFIIIKICLTNLSWAISREREREREREALLCVFESNEDPIKLWPQCFYDRETLWPLPLACLVILTMSSIRKMSKIMDTWYPLGYTHEKQRLACVFFFLFFLVCAFCGCVLFSVGLVHSNETY